jgi:2-polyprenyl-3-methyl-5-hydroxy-6-metoxy-1,4-benzoquinol methylase
MLEFATAQSTKEAFADRTLKILNDAALALMMSVGHRTKLFDTMATRASWSASELADEARLSERYVREWLGAMVTGDVVTFDARALRYSLPAAHAECLTRAARPNNMAVTTQWIAVLGAAEDEVVEAFVHGKGVPYGKYPRFHEVMAEESQQTVVDGLPVHILPLVPGLREGLRRGMNVLDVACGAGRAALSLAQQFPASRFTGVDMSAEAIARADEQAANGRLTNTTFVKADAAEMIWAGTFDLVTAFDAIHDQARPGRVLDRIYAALRPGGVFLMQDILGHTQLADNVGLPLAPFMYTISCMHCMSVSLAAGGPGLGAMWGRELAVQMLEAAGFRDVRVESLPHDPINYYYVAVKPR